MKCEEAAEFLSRLCDGLVIPREVAEHIGTCQVCRTHLSAYLGIGAELRRLASLEQPVILKPRSWDTHEKVRLQWWQKGSETMKIPRFVFALMLVALLVLSLSAGLFLTRAKGTDRWFQYEVLGRDGKRIMRGAVPPNGEGNPHYDAGAGMTYPDGMVWFHVRMIERVGDAEKIGVRAWWVPKGENRGDERQVNTERDFLYSASEDLKIPVEDYGNLEIKGQFSSTLPETVARGMYPEWGKFRIDPPVLLVRGNELLGKFISGGGELALNTSYFAYGQQDEGWYVFSAKPIEGSVEGTITMNDIEFTLDGKQYSLFTGDPIVFGKINMWVKHYASINDADPTSPGDGWQGNVPRLAFGQLQNLAVGK